LRGGPVTDTATIDTTSVTDLADHALPLTRE
jgi:hypothetical protein